MNPGLIFIFVGILACSGSLISKSDFTKTYEDTVTSCLELSYLNGTSYHLILCSKNDTFEYLVDLNNSSYSFVNQYCEKKDTREIVVISESLRLFPLGVGYHRIIAGTPFIYKYRWINRYKIKRLIEVYYR